MTFRVFGSLEAPDQEVIKSITVPVLRNGANMRPECSSLLMAMPLYMISASLFAQNSPIQGKIMDCGAS